MLLSKHSALLRAAEHSGRNDRVVATRGLLTGSLAWLVMGACAVYALVSVVDEELAYQFGTARVTLVITQVRKACGTYYICSRIIIIPSTCLPSVAGAGTRLVG